MHTNHIAIGIERSFQIRCRVKVWPGSREARAISVFYGSRRIDHPKDGIRQRLLARIRTIIGSHIDQHTPNQILLLTG